MKYTRTLIAAIVVLSAVAAMSWYIWDQNCGGLSAGFASGNGRFKADQIDIATKIPGRIAEFRVGEGELVQQGDVLAVMDTRELAAQKARAETDAHRAESQVEELRALIAQRRAEEILSQEEFDRASTLAKRGVTSQQAVDQQETRLASAKAALNAAMAQLNTAERGVAAANALVAQYQTQIEDATLTALVLGRILYRLA